MRDFIVTLALGGADMIVLHYDADDALDALMQFYEDDSLDALDIAVEYIHIQEVAA